MKKSILALLLAGLLALSAVGCSNEGGNSSSEVPPSSTSGASSGGTSSQDPEALQEVTLRLNYTAQGSHAPLFYGIQQGIFQEHGINLVAGEGKGSGTTVNVVASKGDTFGWADCGTTFNLISQGAPVKVVSPTYTKCSFAVISIEENNITKPEDIVGKKIGITEGDGPHKLFGAFLEQVGLSEDDVELIPMDATAKTTALLNHQVDAILGGFDDHPFQIESKGFTPTVIPYADYGVNLIGMSLVAHNDTIADDPDMVKAFVEAYAQSWAEAYKNQDAALDALLEEFPDLDRDTCKNQMEAAFSCLLSDESDGIMRVSDTLYGETMELCKQYMGLDEAAKAEDLYVTDFQPETKYTLD